MTRELLLDTYETQRPALEALRAKLELELRDRLARHAEISVHFVSSRLKTRASLAAKLARPDRTYARLWDVTDLVGLRVAVYFEDALEPLCRLVEELFTVDFRHSAHKARSATGYRSVHYVCTPKEGAPHPDFRFEVQLRTALQHAWAEVEHDLGYKAGDTVPEAIRRRFVRVASLLEIADDEFVAIRRELERSRASAAEALSRGDDTLPVDLTTLEPLLQVPSVAALDAEVAKALGRPQSAELFFPDYLVKLLRLVGLTTSHEVLEAAAAHAPALAVAVARYFEFSADALALEASAVNEVKRGYGLFFLAHLAVVRGPEPGLKRVARLARVYEALDFPGDEAAAHRVASGLVAALGP